MEHEICPQCDGNKLVVDENGNLVKCPECNGNGFTLPRRMTTKIRTYQYSAQGVINTLGD